MPESYDERIRHGEPAVGARAGRFRRLRARSGGRAHVCRVATEKPANSAGLQLGGGGLLDAEFLYASLWDIDEICLSCNA